MKKFIFCLFMLLIIPCYTFAACDTNKHEKLKTEASNITYVTNYSTSTKKFDVTFDNVSSEIYAVYNGITYKPSNSSIKITNIGEGTSLRVSFKANDGCDNELDIKIISIPYYNNYYGTALCTGYENILTVCNSQFTKSKVTKDLVLDTIDNYENNIIEVPEKEEEVVAPEKTIIDITIDFSKKWGLKILMSIGSCLVSYMIGSILYRKELHGV